MTPGIPSAEGVVPAELVERMVALVRELAAHPAGLVEWHSDSARATEARAIAALLPEPVDPDIEEAKACAFAAGFGRVSNDSAIGQAFLQAIKRGRELAKRDPSHAA